MVKAALITGGAQRLGAAMARHLAREGWAVAVHYASSSDAAEALVTELRDAGTTAEALQADLLQDAEVAELVPRAATALGMPLSLLVNNASIFEHDRLDTMTGDSWTRHIGSNLKAPVFLSQAFAAQAPRAARDAAGEPVAQAVIVNMLDQRVLKPTPEFMTYSLAKAGLWAFTRTAAQALGPDIRVAGIGPGPTLQGERQSPEHFARQRAATILERGSDPSEICAALDFILKTPGFTGQMLALDGGQHLGWQTPDVLGVE
ncbi:SDR family oxidoreductase [Oceanomicrobium pacificus]|uniref:SDR family oxidoreductase n=1 Tax=Oceanomicrobium pacificus TaxID=2692916 RepID=A0A6B0TZU9_9RHOB|nr:SDR family oxidoreductase [Oceanomicrobium pacificus]MXU66782.1 SDR family oxidoreductase [Oceanomicrobium pacificus]